MQAKIEKLTSLMEGDTYCTLSIFGEGVPLAPHCNRMILRAPHPMYPKTLDHNEDHVVMSRLLEDICDRINSYERLKLVEEEFQKTLAWLGSVTFENAESEYEKSQLLERLSQTLSEQSTSNPE